MKFKNVRSGVILTPRSEMVAQQLAKSPEWEEIVEKPAEKEKPKGKKK